MYLPINRITAQTPMTVMLRIKLGSKASQWGREEKSSPTKGSWTPEENMKVRRGQDAEMKTGWKQSMWIWKEWQEKASCSISKCDFGEHFKDDHQVFQCELQKCQRGSVRTYAGPKLLQETVILWRVWRRQHLRPVVTSQLDAHEAKRLRSKRDEIITRACTRFTRSHTVYILSVFTYAGSVRDQERVSGRHTSMCVQSSVSAKAVAQRCCHTHRAELLWLLNWRSQKHKNAHWTAFYRILFTRFQLLRTFCCSKIHLPRRWLSLCSFPKIINVGRDCGGGSGQWVHFRCFYISFNLKVLIQKSWKLMRCRGAEVRWTHKNILPVDFEAEPRTVHLLDQSDLFSEMIGESVLW